MTPPPEDKPAPAFWRWLVALIVVATLFWQLGARALNEPDEGRYAEIAREMVASGDWLTPRMNGVAHLSKPPIAYWAVAASLKIFGINEFAARLPVALAALATLLGVYKIGRSALGERQALLAAVMLLTCLEFFIVARLVTTDMILCCFITWSVVSIWSWHAGGSPTWKRIVPFYVFLALGMLTKGPVAIALPLLAVLGLRWKNSNFHLRQMHPGKGLLLFLALVVPWFAAVAGSNADIWRYFIFREVVERYASNIHHRSQPFWFFIPVLAGGFLPWTGLLPALWRRQGDSPRLAAFGRMCATWAAGGLLIFSLSQSKMMTYLLPLFPPLALLAALVVARNSRPVKVCLGLSLILLPAAITVLLTSLASKQLMNTAAFRPVFIVCAAGFLAGAYLFWKWPPLKFSAFLAGYALAVWVSMLSVYGAVERDIRQNTTAKYFAEKIRKEDPKGVAPVISYRTFMCGLPFYLQKEVLRYNPQTDQQNLPRKLVFEYGVVRPEEPFVLDNKFEIRGLVAAHKPVFFVALDDMTPPLKRESRATLYKIDRIGRWALLSTQPCPGAEPLH